jgi:regulator of sigma E protease
VYAWIEPVVDSVKKDSAAFIAGLEPGDRILRVNGKDIPHTLALNQIIQQSTSQPLSLTYEREGRVSETRIIPRSDAEGRMDTGIIYRPVRHSSPKLGPPEALARGTAETFDTLKITVKSLGLLFKGIDLSQAVSGPLRITYFVGEVATQGFSKDFTTGVTSILNFLSLLSVALFFMNLLPIPALDGGLILLFIVEGIRGKPLSPRFIYRYQFVGIFFILLLLVLSTMSDVFYFFRK